MLDVTAEAVDLLQVDTDLLVVPVFKGGIEGPGAGPVLDALGLHGLPVTPGFRGDIGEHLLLASPGLGAGGVLLVGLGRMDETDAERLRRAAGVAARAARRVARVATTLAEVHTTDAAIEAVAQGFHLGAYDARRLGAEADRDLSRLRELVVLLPSSRLAGAPRALRRAQVYARATCVARDLVNLPPDRKRPAQLAEAIAALADGACDVVVWDETALRLRGFGALLAVGGGSTAPPRLVELRYRPASPLGHVVLIGKGVTFDSGGLSLKRGEEMADMKADMAGAAAVAAACAALDALDVRLEVTGLLPLAENMPGADALRPGDVVSVHGGTTVEVRDTDAEGRLLVAEALHRAVELRPDAVVDLATLTGSAIAAIGSYAAALMGNDDELLDSLRRAAGVAGEPVWQLPLWPDLERFLQTPVADVNNTGDGPGAGAIMGGLFLRGFAGAVPWAHLDIAGPAFLSPELAAHYLPVGGTGYGVRTLLAWLERRGS